LPVGATGRTTDCQPLNIFGSGPGVASQAAIDYIQATAHAGGNANTTWLTEDVGAGTIQGKLPFGTSAGQVAMAAGFVYRKEVGLKKNCGFNCDNVKFPLGNFASFDAGYNTKEGSLEFNAPLLKDTFVQDLSIDLAYRGIQYSTSGFVSTYKFGVLSQINDVIRVRASYSRDIRAGNLSELFGQRATDGSSGVDPRTGINTADFTIHAGNPDVQPETAETRTFGIVLTPIQGLFASLDWYDIRIKDVINGGLSQSAIVNGCLAGNSQYCSFIYYGNYPDRGGCSTPTPTGCPLSLPLFGILSAAVNSDNQTTSGLDFVADYRTPFLGGALNINASANYVFSLRYTTLGQTCDPMNGLANSQGTYGGCNVPGNPKFKANLGVTYAQDGWTGSIQSRMIGAAHLVSQWESGIQIANNDIPFYTYFDLRLSYAFESGVTIYSAIDNVLDKTVPPTPASAYTGSTLFDPDTRDDIYDGYGRVWRLGLRVRL
jgi:outer membrane receptor protein involved in Fe transport